MQKTRTSTRVLSHLLRYENGRAQIWGIHSLGYPVHGLYARTGYMCTVVRSRDGQKLSLGKRAWGRVGYLCISATLMQSWDNWQKKASPQGTQAKA